MQGLVVAVDAYVTQEAYLHHLAPVWRALPADQQGAIYAELNSDELWPAAARRGLAPLARHRPPANTTDPVIAAGGGDLIALGGTGRPIVLLEHGAGQSYLPEVDSVSYSGGIGRDGVTLFLCPNATVAARNLKRYPSAQAVVVGAPAVPGARSYRRVYMCTPGDNTCTGRPVVAVTGHWRCPINPETQPVLGEYADAYLALGSTWNLIGHGHPRDAAWYRDFWTRHNIEWVADWADARNRADVLVADNSSTLVEAARLGIPVVLVNGRHYRRNVEHGARFYEWCHDGLGVVVDRPADLHAAVGQALADPAVAERGQTVATRIFPYVGRDAAERAAAAIMAL